MPNKINVLSPSESYVFWYKSDQDVYKSEVIHIQFVIDNPKLFNISRDRIEKIYQAFDEPLGTEGKARMKILEQLFKEGWVRVRFNGSLKKWFIEVDDKSKRENRISRCINYFTNIQGLMNAGDEIVLLEEDNE